MLVWVQTKGVFSQANVPSTSGDIAKVSSTLSVPMGTLKATPIALVALMVSPSTGMVWSTMVFLLGAWQAVLPMSIRSKPSKLKSWEVLMTFSVGLES